MQPRPTRDTPSVASYHTHDEARVQPYRGRLHESMAAEARGNEHILAFRMVPDEGILIQLVVVVEPARQAHPHTMTRTTPMRVGQPASTPLDATYPAHELTIFSSSNAGQISASVYAPEVGHGAPTAALQAPPRTGHITDSNMSWSALFLGTLKSLDA